MLVAGGGGGVAGVTANENKFSQKVTMRPKKLWRSNSIFILCIDIFVYIFCKIYTIFDSGVGGVLGPASSAAGGSASESPPQDTDSQ